MAPDTDRANAALSATATVLCNCINTQCWVITHLLHTHPTQLGQALLQEASHAARMGQWGWDAAGPTDAPVLVSVGWLGMDAPLHGGW